MLGVQLLVDGDQAIGRSLHRVVMTDVVEAGPPELFPQRRILPKPVDAVGEARGVGLHQQAAARPLDHLRE